VATCQAHGQDVAAAQTAVQEARAALASHKDAAAAQAAAAQAHFAEQEGIAAKKITHAC
jgi:hypothetical protein